MISEGEFLAFTTSSNVEKKSKFMKFIYTKEKNSKH